MSIETLLLYGSRARGDFEEASDVDLLGITSDEHYALTANGNVNIVHYSNRHAFNRAMSGDLFFLHIVREAKILYDTKENFIKLKKSFKYKDNYFEEISAAADLGWFLIQGEKDIMNYTLLNRRIAWCVRTILIAKSAENRNPVFSAAGLKFSTDAPFVDKLISNKDRDVRSGSILKGFRKFLEYWDFLPPLSEGDSMHHKYAEYFSLTKNDIGLQTILGLTTMSELTSYGKK